MNVRKSKSAGIHAVILVFALGTAGNLTAQNLAPSPTPPPTTSVQIINATSVPEISLSVNGSMSYPVFPQAILTSDAPIPLRDLRYVAVDKKSGARVESDVIKFQVDANQSLVIMGDFSTMSPPGNLPQPEQPAAKPTKTYPPNVVFKVYMHKKPGPDGMVRLRVINGMPGKKLTFAAGSDSREILPGGSAEFAGQPGFSTCQAQADDQKITVSTRQSGIVRDVMVVFYLKAGKPAFLRAFENTAQPSPEN